MLVAVRSHSLVRRPKEVGRSFLLLGHRVLSAWVRPLQHCTHLPPDVEGFLESRLRYEFLHSLSHTQVLERTLYYFSTSTIMVQLCYLYSQSYCRGVCCRHCVGGNSRVACRWIGFWSHFSGGGLIQRFVSRNVLVLSACMLTRLRSTACCCGAPR